MTPAASTFSPLTNASVLPSAHAKTLGNHDCNFEAVPALQGVRSPLRPTGSLPTLRPFCSPHIFMQLRHGPKARYGWVANPYRRTLLPFFPTGTFTLQDAPRFAESERSE